MKFYTKTHKHYCGIDLHPKWRYLCILNQVGDTIYHRNLRTDRENVLKAIAPIVRIWWSRLSACSLDTGSPITVRKKGSRWF